MMEINDSDRDRNRAQALARGYLSGSISRRELLRRSVLFGGATLATTTLGPLLTACSSSTDNSPNRGSSGSSAGGTPVPGGTLNAGITGDPANLDPALTSLYASLQVLDNIFSTLVRMDDKGNFVPDLAKSWKQNDDRTYTFNLVHNATFHNGEKFTANDVKYTFERLVNPKTASPWAADFSAIDSVEVKSPTVAIFHLKQAYAPFLTSLAHHGEIVNQKAVESGDPTTHPVGTGPFTFVEYVQNDHITLKKNPNYFVSGKPYLDKIVFTFPAVDQSRITALQAGQLDWVDAVPLNQLTALKDNSAYTYVTSSVAGIPDFLAMNCSEPPFNNGALRQAVAYALDYKAILNIAYSGAGEVGSQEVPSGSRFYGGSDPYAGGPNIPKAMQLMAQAGLSGGLTINMLSLSQYPELAKTAVVVQDQLKQIRINVKIEQLEVTVWLDRYSKKNYEITPTYWASTVDPDDFYSTQLASTSTSNYTGYSNHTLDALIAKARSESDPGRRKSLYEQIRAIVWEDAPVIFSHYETLNYLMTNKVHGSTVTPTLQLNMDDIWKSK